MLADLETAAAAAAELAATRAAALATAADAATAAEAAFAADPDDDAAWKRVAAARGEQARRALAHQHAARARDAAAAALGDAQRAAALAEFEGVCREASREAFGAAAHPDLVAIARLQRELTATAAGLFRKAVAAQAAHRRAHALAAGVGRPAPRGHGVGLAELTAMIGGAVAYGWVAADATADLVAVAGTSVNLSGLFQPRDPLTLGDVVARAAIEAFGAAPLVLVRHTPTAADAPPDESDADAGDADESAGEGWTAVTLKGEVA